MSTETISFNVTMTIDLADGELSVPRKERDAIAERLYQEIATHGITNDDYEGSLVYNGRVPELSVLDKKNKTTFIDEISSRQKSITFLTNVIDDNAENVYDTIMNADDQGEYMSEYATFREGCEDMSNMSICNFINIFF